GCGLESFPVGAAWFVDVDVRVHETGENDQAREFHRLAGRWADRGDTAAFEVDGGRNEAAVGQDAIGGDGQGTRHATAYGVLWTAGWGPTLNPGAGCLRWLHTSVEPALDHQHNSSRRRRPAHDAVRENARGDG